MTLDMKKSLIFIICLNLILILSFSIISAFSFPDFWNKITGRDVSCKYSGESCTELDSTIKNEETLIVGNYQVHTVISGINAVQLIISYSGNVESTDQMEKGEKVILGNGNYLIVTDIIYEDSPGGIKQATFSIGDCCSGLSCQSGICKSFSCKSNSGECSSTDDCCSGLSCIDGACCILETCASLNYNCGTWDNGCLGTLMCGTCGTGETCSNGICSTCKSSGQSCNGDDDCCSGLNCENNFCVSSILPTPICTDSDDGMNIYLKGHTIESNQQASPSSSNVDIWDICVKNSNDSINSIKEEFKNNLYEYGCRDGHLYSRMYTCPEDCNDGACKPGTCKSFGQSCMEDAQCCSGFICSNNTCSEIIPMNKKSMSKYSDKEAFLISDKNWKDVLPLIPVTTWTEGDEIKKYPTLIYHEEITEGDSFLINKENLGIYPHLGGKIDTVILTLEEKELHKGETLDFLIQSYNPTETVQAFGIRIPINLFINFYFSSNEVTIWCGDSSCTISNQGELFELSPGKTKEFRVKITFANRKVFFDADSIIYFMQQYSPSKVTIISETPQELDNLLIAEPELGAGLNEPQIQRINPEDYLNYWETFNNIVYVQDDYELALLASTYASLINAPLIIKGTNLDTDITFAGKNIICVGDVTPSGNTCKGQYNLEELRKKYVYKTNANKVILVNPKDLDISVNENLTEYSKKFCPSKSSNCFYNLYTKTSLVAPILASAKHELILSTHETNYQNIDGFIESRLSNMNYLTIIASPDAVPYRERMSDIEGYENYRALDQTEYADINNDMRPDISTGRIMGISSSDVSSYIARDLFYDLLQKTNNMKFLASSFSYMIEQTTQRTTKFSEAGYNANSITSEAISYSFQPSEWENNDLISYQDHGNFAWAGILSSDIPLLSNSIVFNDACSTCSTYDSLSFCNRAIRNGALAYLGAVSIAWIDNDIYRNTMSGIYYNKLTIGEAFKNAYTPDKSTPDKFRYMTILLGDPTLNLNPEHFLSQPLLY